MISRFPITQKGYDKLIKELKSLKYNDRQLVIEAIATARDHGDLSENAEYHAAKEKQGFIEGTIKDLESKASRAEIIDPQSMSGDIVKFGATVILANTDNDQESTYHIVGDYEADVKKNLISISAPIAKALIGKSVGDLIKINTPNNTKEYEIIDIKYISFDV